MKILVINTGSTSLKFKVFDGKLNNLAGGIIEKIGEKKSIFKYTKGKYKISAEYKIINHEAALNLAINHLLDQKIGVINKLKEIKVIGHRVVHGGNISKTSLINAKILKLIEDSSELAALHNPINLEGISICKKIFKGTKQVAAFDTAFHQSIPEKNYIYPLPYEFYRDNGIRKFGFHGIAHQYLVKEAARILKISQSRVNLITCHLGAGCSITAIKNGKSLDTSMGFTPIGGLMMSTRSGDIDPSVITYMIKSMKISALEVDNILNNKSGLLGVSGISRDMRDIIKNYNNNKRCKLALDIFIQRVRKYIGFYLAELGGVNAIVFSGGIGSRSNVARKMICDNLDHLGISLDVKKNEKAIDQKSIISSVKSKIKIITIPSNEEKMIAMEAKKLI